MSDFLDLLRCFDGTSLKTKGGQRQLPVSLVIREIETLETRILKMQLGEVAREMDENEVPEEARHMYVAPKAGRSSV